MWDSRKRYLTKLGLEVMESVSFYDDLCKERSWPGGIAGLLYIILFIVHIIFSSCSSGDRDPTDPGLLEYDEETQGNKEGRNLTIPSTDPQFKITKNFISN